jgi:hypothetical protein
MVSFGPSNDPLLGLDSADLVEEQQPKESKWVDVPEKRRTGYAEKILVAAGYKPCEIYEAMSHPVKAMPLPPIVEPTKVETVESIEMPVAVVLPKPSWVQRFLDYFRF